MSFNEIDIFLFEKFFSSKTDSKSLLNMIQMNFNEKLDKANEIKIINRLYDLPYIIINYLFAKSICLLVIIILILLQKKT